MDEPTNRQPPGLSDATVAPPPAHRPVPSVSGGSVETGVCSRRDSAETLPSPVSSLLLSLAPQGVGPAACRSSLRSQPAAAGR